MPFTQAWSLETPFEGAAPIAPAFATAAALGGDCGAPSYDQARLLRGVDRALPESYLLPMKQNPASGYEHLQAAAKIGERVSLAIERFECGSWVSFAPVGAKATGTVSLYRTTNAAGAITINAGTVFRASKSGRRFVLLANVVFGGTDLGPITGSVEAEAEGYEWNLPGQVVTPYGDTLLGEIDTIESLYTTPVFGDITFYVRQLLPTTGGTPPMLDALGQDRGMPRLPAELDDAYRYRLRVLPDTISPGAVRRLCDAYLTKFGMTYEFIETWQLDYQTCWDAPSPNIGTPTYQATPPTAANYYDNLFVWDDPYATRAAWPNPQFRNRWLDDVELRGAFIVVINPTDPTYDNTAAGAAAVYGLYQQLLQIKLAGVAAIIEREGE